MRRVLENLNTICPLTHRRNILDNTNEFIKDSSSGDVALVDGITAADRLVSVSRPVLTGRPLQLVWVPRRTSRESHVGATALDNLLIKVIEFTGRKIGPSARLVEGFVEIGHEVDSLILFHTARLSVIVGGLFEVVSEASGDDQVEPCIPRPNSWSTQ